MSNITENKRAAPRIAVAFLALALGASSCGRGTNQNVKIDGVEGPHVNFIDNKFTLAMTLQNVTFDAGLRIPVPKMPNSYVEIGPDFQSNGMLVSIGVDARDLNAILGNPVNILDPLALPGGRPLPTVAAGQLPGLAVQVPQLKNVTFYIGKEVFGVFVPVELPWDGVGGSFRFYDGAGDRIGTLSIIGKDEAKENSGVLLLISLKGKVGKLLK